MKNKSKENPTCTGRSVKQTRVCQNRNDNF